jgi:thioredoxin 1
MMSAAISRKLPKSVAVLSFFLVAFLGSATAQEAGTKAAQGQSTDAKPLATFIELGSINCVPCKAMRPVMTDIETSYKGKVKVLFYDVWTKEGEPYGRKFGIRVIPTQVFLDKDGKEFYRHEGFFLASDIKKMLADNGVNP